MLLELYNNRKTIFKNYANLIYDNRKWICIILTLFGLIFIYSLLVIKEYNIDTSIKANMYINEQFINFKLKEKTELELFKKKEYFDDINKNKLLYIINPSENKEIINNLNSWIYREYLIHMNEVNYIARGFENLELCKIKYETELLDEITLDEETKAHNKIKECVDTLSSNKKNWITNILNKCKITKGKEWLEMSMPHTHANVIIFNQEWFNTLSWSTFVHECVHIDQRIELSHNNYYKLYKQWGFITYNINLIKGMENIILRNRLNPDGIDCNFIWNCPIDGKFYWIGAVFNNIIPSNLSDVQNISISLINDGKGHFYYNGNNERQLNNWNEFNIFFGITNNNYHPAEIVAEYMSILFDNNDKLNNNDNIINKHKKNKAFVIFNDWFINSNI